MTRFRALNESTSESEDDNEEKETKEAQEERAFAQYNHGLLLQSEEKYGEAEEMYTNLLQSPFLEQVIVGSADGSDSFVRPAAALKYGCLKNLGVVLVKRGNIQEGLDCYLKALDLDNSDVTLWHRAGKVALMVKRLDLARYAFQQALQCNSRYWPSLDALIPVLYALGDALGCIVLCYRALHLDRGYPLARAFRARILKEQPSLTEYLDALDIDHFDIVTGDNDDSEELVKVAQDLQTLWRDSEKDLPQLRLSGLEDKPLTVTVSCPSWLAVGKALLQLYRRIASSDPAVSFLNLAKMELASSESAANSKGSTPPSGPTAPEGESDTDVEEQTEEDVTEASGQEQEDVNKMGARKRRRSSISLLDSYKRRSMRVRNGVRREQEKEDTSLADALRSLLPPSLHITNIETESESEKRKKDVRRLADALAWGDDSDDAALELCRLLEQRESETGQTQASQSRHDIFAKKLKEEGYFGTEQESNDVIAFIESDQSIVVDFLSSFLGRLSALSSLSWPVGLSRVYTDVYQYYRSHVHQPPSFSFSVSTEDLKTDAELTLLYSELFLDRMMQNNKHSNSTPCQLVEHGIAHIATFVGRPDLIGYPSGRRLILRGMWIKVLYSLHRDDSPSAIHTLRDIIYFIENFIGEEDLKYKESRLPVKDKCPEKSSKPANLSEEKTEELVELPKDTMPEISPAVKSVDEDDTTKAVLKVESLQVPPAEVKMDVDNILPPAVVDSEKATTTEKPEITKELKELAKIQCEFSVVLPNCVNNFLISKMSTQRLLTTLTRKQQLKKMEKLYDSCQFSELVDMLADCFKFCAQQVDSGNDNADFENLPDRPTQMAMLLDSLWKLERYNDCVYWAEACLHEAHGRYLNTSEENREQQVWATVVENILLGMYKCLSLSPAQSFKAMPRTRMSRLVQTLSSLLCHQLDQQDSTDVPVECTTAWLLIYRVTRFEESNLKDDEVASIPRSLMVLFTAHDHMAKRGWCSQGEGRLLLAILDGVLTHLRRAELCRMREEMTHQAEQAIFCLFKHPQKAKEQGRKRYLQDHKVPSQLTLTLDRAMQLLEFVRPDESPQFDSVPDASIDADCETLLKRIADLIPQELMPPKAREELRAYIKGQTDSLPQTHYSLPPRATDLLYLLADYYCKKNVEKTKYETAIKYFVEDLCANPLRFDSWASMGLVRSTKLSTKLNCCDRLNIDEMLAEMSEAKRCFQRALELNENNIIMIELGSFAYCMHSYCSRLLKADPNDTNVDMFDEMLSQASKCFTTASKTVQDERWLPEYMLGKIAEKRGEEPATFLRHYQMAAMLLDESGAEYPSTLEYDSKLRLACEAHEVHYRIHASILKQLLQSLCRPMDTATYELYRCCLAKFAEGPFMKSAGHVVAPLKELLQVRGSFQPSVRSKPAKVHHAKRKSSDKSGDETASKKIKVETQSGVVPISKQETDASELTETVTESKTVESLNVETKPVDVKPADSKPVESNPSDSEPAETNSFPLRVESQPMESQPAESKSAESSPTDSNPAESNLVDSNLADGKPVDDKSTESKIAKETTKQTEPQDEVKTEPASSNNATSSSSSASSSSDSSSDSDSSSGSSSDSSDSGSSSDSSDSEESSDSSAADDENKTSAKPGAENQEGLKEKTGKEAANKSSEKVKRSPPTETLHDVGPLVRACLYAMEECLLRYPRHYKSLYRLAHYYFSPGEHRDLEKCWQLLLGKYFIERANRHINGLFKSDNFRTMFSDIWRIQSEEVDRAGSFAAHMSRSVLLVLQLLRDKRDHQRLIQLAAYLYKDPESARSKYLRDNERKELAQQAVEMCIMVMRNAVPETNSVDSLMDIFSTVLTAVNVIQELPRSSAETFRLFLCDAFKNTKDLKSTNYDAAFDFCRREKAARKRQAAAEAATAANTAEAAQASQQLQVPPAVSSSLAPTASSSPHLPTITISKVAPNPPPSRFSSPATPWTSMPHAPMTMGGKVGRPPKKPVLPPMPTPSGYGPGRISVEQLLMSMGMNLNDLPYSASSVQQGMNLLAQIQQPPPQFRPQQLPKTKPKVAPVVSNIVKDRPGISITPLQTGGSRKQFNLPPRNQLLVEPVKGLGPAAGPSPQPLWPGAPRGRAAQHTPRGGISVVPASRLLKAPGTEASVAALSRHSQLVVTPRPRGRPPNPLNAGRGRSRLNPQTPWLGMNLPLGGVSPGAPTVIRPSRPASPRSHAHLALARAQAFHELEQAKQRAKQQMQLQPRQPLIRPPVRLPATVSSTVTAPVATAAAPSSSAALLDPEIITLE